MILNGNEDTCLVGLRRYFVPLYDVTRLRHCITWCYYDVTMSRLLLVFEALDIWSYTTQLFVLAVMLQSAMQYVIGSWKKEKSSDNLVSDVII